MCLCWCIYDMHWPFKYAVYDVAFFCINSALQIKRHKTSTWWNDGCTYQPRCSEYGVASIYHFNPRHDISMWYMLLEKKTSPTWNSTYNVVYSIRVARRPRGHWHREVTGAFHCSAIASYVLFEYPPSRNVLSLVVLSTARFHTKDQRIKRLNGKKIIVIPGHSTSSYAAAAAAAVCQLCYSI